MIETVNFRPIKEIEYPLLEEFCYYAIFLPPGVEPLPREVVYDPKIYIYINKFGGADDCGVVAEREGKIIGAAWTRIINAFGYIDDETPELAISVLPGYRNLGVGAGLMARLFEMLRERGYKRTSLSVQKNNPAVRFYERAGYGIYGKEADHADSDDYLMVKELA